jgi:fructose-bisphosphate aldolase class 1
MDPLEHAKMMKKMCHADGFIAALDQSGGSSKLLLSLSFVDSSCSGSGKEALHGHPSHKFPS